MRPSVLRRGAAAGVVALCLSWGFAVRAEAAVTARSTTHTVIIDGVRCQPEVLTIKAGDEVVWINKDPFPHTATSDSGRFDSKEIASGASWRHAMGKAGTFVYICTLHPTMKATLIVQ